MQVFEFIGLTELYYAGSHGMDIMGPATHSVSVNGHLDCIRTTDEQVKTFCFSHSFLVCLTGYG